MAAILREASLTYRLVARYMNGPELVGYQITSSVGDSINVKKAVAEQLAAEGLIENCKVIVIDGKTYVKGVGIRISELPVLNMRTGEVRNIQATGVKSVNTMVVVARMVASQRVVGYIVKDASGKQYRLSKDKVWELARSKRITNVSAELNGLSKILRGEGIYLNKLPTVNVD